MAQRDRLTAGKWWPLLAEAAKQMRLNPTPEEKLVWQELRNSKLRVRFRRQHIINRFIVDFVCLQRKLIGEVDGPIHETEESSDSARDAKLLDLGFRTLRFSNGQVTKQMARVIEKIRHELDNAKVTGLVERKNNFFDKSPLHPERGGSRSEPG